MTKSDRTSNRLINEKSPYLLQHAYNPVDWYPWGEEAFSKARAEDKPVFLSIGYSTCHWCHVMEKESFEDEEVARILNSRFVPVKVDREERPDVDHIYMEACLVLKGHGGWPLTIFLTPDRIPFHAGTYYPKNDRYGMPGLISILNRVADLWNSDRGQLLRIGRQLEESIKMTQFSKGDGPDNGLPEKAFIRFKKSFDKEYGGFGNAPKFPTPHNLLFLLRYWRTTGNDEAQRMVEKTLESMRRGGIHDHIGYGFSRYSTDIKWLVPHFEKMLYDNALLSIAFLEAYLASGKKIYAETADNTLHYVLRDMTSPEGGFYTAEDADSEGVEGKFYVWSPGEVIEVLGNKDGERFCKLYDITDKGNFEGLSIPNLIKSDLSEIDRAFASDCLRKLFERREKRIHPFKDDKILTAWNGLMIAAMSMGGRVLGQEKYINAAENAVKFVFSRLIGRDGRLLARYRDGEAAVSGFAEDYAYMVLGLLELYETLYKPEYLEKALQLNNDMLRLFWDDENGGLFMYGNDSEQLPVRPKVSYDGAMPSANSVAALNLLKLARIAMKPELEEKANGIFKAFGDAMSAMPDSHSMMLCAYLYAVSPSKELIVASGKPLEKCAEDELIAAASKIYDPFMVTVCLPEGAREIERLIPPAAGYKKIGGVSTAYVCSNFKCSYPVTDTASLVQLLQQ